MKIIINLTQKAQILSFNIGKAYKVVLTKY